MMSPDPRRVLGRLPDGEFVNRQWEIERLISLGAGTSSSANALIIGKPHSGKTELLRMVFDHLWARHQAVLPIYFPILDHPAQAEDVAGDSIRRLLAQFIAFRRGDPALVSAGRSVLDAAAAALPEDYSAAREIIDLAEVGPPDQSIASCLSAIALMCHRAGLRLLLMIDDFDRFAQNAATLRTWQRLKSTLLTEASPVARGADPPVVVLSGLRRAMLEMIPPDDEMFTDLDRLEVAPLSDEAIQQIIQQHSARLGLVVSESTAELMVQQLGPDLFYLRSVLAAASSRATGLKTFMEFERIYTEEILGGRIGHYFDALLLKIGGDRAAVRAMFEALVSVIDAPDGLPFDAVARAMRTPPAETGRLLAALNRHELLDLGLGYVRRSDDLVLADYVRTRYRDEIRGERRTLAGHELLATKLKDSYRLMMSRYNRAVQAQLVDLLLRFDFQSAPAVLLEAEAFEDRFGGFSRAQIRRSLDDQEERIRLPQVAYVSDLGGGETAGLSWRMVAACGFEGGVYSEANEVLWLITLLNSKEPIDAPTAAAANRRLDSVEWPCGSRASADNPWTRGRIVRWLIAKEGFDAGALQEAAETRVYCSTYSQLDLLHEHLIRAGAAAPMKAPISEFELVIPIEDEAELIAARTVEQIARAADFSGESINQIKTALIEACLNAAEHSDSPDRRIYQKFELTEASIVITVFSKGKELVLVDGQPAFHEGSVNRGRGLQIIRALMDEVRFERVDGGTRIMMTKNLRRDPDIK